MTERKERNVEDDNSKSASPCGDCKEKLEHLAILSQAWSVSDSGYWTVFGTFWATNAILLVALFDQGKLPRNSFISWVVCGAGCAASAVWAITQGGALYHQRRLENSLRKLESSIIPDDDLRVTSHLGVPWARILMVVCSIIAFAGWLYLLYALLVLRFPLDGCGSLQY
jgi:hypothetical protein